MRQMSLRCMLQVPQVDFEKFLPEKQGPLDCDHAGALAGDNLGVLAWLCRLR